MAFRFRKSIKIAPGIRLNIGKTGVSTSVGRPGATVNFSKRGTRVTAGIPGTGLSASHLYKAAPQDQPQPGVAQSSRPAKLIGWVFMLIILAIMLKSCSTDKVRPQSSESPGTPSLAAPASTSTSQQAFSPAMAPVATAVAASTATQATVPQQIKTLYVGPKSINIRSTPNGTVSGSLKHGAAVTVHTQEGSWGRISPDGQPAKWVSTSLLCKQSDCSDTPKWKTASTQPAAPAPTPAPTSKAAPST